MKLAKKVMAIFNRSIDSAALLAIVLIIFLMVVVCTEVVARYFLNRSIIWMVEVTEYSLLYITFLAAAWVLKRDGHIKVDLVLNQLNVRTRALVNFINYILCGITCLALAWYSLQVTWQLFQYRYYMPTVLEPPKFAIFAVIPVGSFLLFIQFLRGAYGYLGSRRGLGEEKEGYRVMDEGT